MCIEIQDYHAGLGRRDAAGLVHGDAGDPDNAPARILDHRHTIADFPGNLAIDEEVLQCLTTGRPKGLQPIARAAAADEKWRGHRPALQHRSPPTG